MIQNDPDWNMAEAVARGDDDALERLMERFKRPVHNFVFRLLYNAAEAEDVAQDVFVRVYRALRARTVRRGSAAFSTWLFQVARHAAYDRQRWRRRHPEAPLTDAELAPAATGASPGENAENEELSRDIAAAVGALPEDQRTAIVLFEYEGLSHSEIAAVMQCTEKSVEARLYRARRRLRERLNHWMG